MKSFRPWLLLLLALVSGTAAAMIALQYLRPRSLEQLSATSAPSRVVVATRSLPVGTILSKSDVRQVEWPSQAVPEGYITMIDQAVGHGVMAPIQTNEPLLTSKLAGSGAGGGLPVAMPLGMRAVSVRVDEIVGVAGFVLPGTRVDVMVTLTGARSDQNISTRVILQNMLVLAAGQSVERDAEEKPRAVTVITLLTTPSEAETLALASNQGRIQMALRPALDTVQVATSGASMANLLGARPAPPSSPRRARVAPTPTPESRATVVEGFMGGQRTLTRFGPGRTSPE